MSSGENVLLHSDEGTIWFSCDEEYYEKSYLNFETDSLIFMDGLIGVHAKVSSYEDGDESTVELLRELPSDVLEFNFVGEIEAITDKSGVLNIGWLVGVDSGSFDIPKKEKILISFWINDNKDHIKLFVE